MESKLKDAFPDAIPIDKVARASLKVLGEFDFTPKNTLFGTCFCRDELNSSSVSIFSDIWGENFKLAGLAGYPSVGITGVSAYSGHIDEHGRLFVFYGSHIAISEQMVIGEIRRDKMAIDTPTCGSLARALESIKSGTVAESINPLDAEQSLVELALAQLGPKRSLKIEELTNLMAGVIGNTLDELYRQSNIQQKAAFLGGVLINTPKSFSDYFVPMFFKADSAEQKSVDILHRLSNL